MARREIEKIALYARVSTHDQQTLPMQLSAMRAYAKRKGWQVTLKIEEVGSGATLRIPTKADSHSDRKRTVIPIESGQ